MPDLTFLNEVFHRPRHFFDRHVWVDTVLIEEIDEISFESLERGVRGIPDVLGPAVQASLFAVRVEVEPELCGDHDFSAEGSEGLADELFVGERSVHFRRIEERDAAFHGCPDNRDHFLLVFGRAVAEAHSHAAESDRGDFQAALPKFALLHISPSRVS